MRTGIKRKDGLRLALALAVLIALLLSVTGCDPCARLSRRCPPVENAQDSVWVHDSVRVERWQTDTVVRVRLERETVRETVDIGDTARAETMYAWALSYADGARLVLRLENKDSAEMLAQRLHVLESRLKEAYSRRSETKVVTEYRTRGIVKALAWCGGAALLFLSGFAVARIMRRLKL